MEHTLDMLTDKTLLKHKVPCSVFHSLIPIRKQKMIYGIRFDLLRFVWCLKPPGLIKYALCVGMPLFESNLQVSNIKICYLANNMNV